MAYMCVTAYFEVMFRFPSIILVLAGNLYLDALQDWQPKPGFSSKITPPILPLRTLTFGNFKNIPDFSLANYQKSVFSINVPVPNRVKKTNFVLVWESFDVTCVARYAYFEVMFLIIIFNICGKLQDRQPGPVYPQNIFGTIEIVVSFMSRLTWWVQKQTMSQFQIFACVANCLFWGSVFPF